VVIEELLPLGGHLVVVVHIPGGFLLASKLVQLLHTLPTLGWQLLVAGTDSWLVDSWLTDSTSGHLMVEQISDPSGDLFHWRTQGCPDYTWLFSNLLSSLFREAKMRMAETCSCFFWMAW
jgi:hypothetical protein